MASKRSRTSNRIVAKKVTATKSEHFKHSDSSEVGSDSFSEDGDVSEFDEAGDEEEDDEEEEEIESEDVDASEEEENTKSKRKRKVQPVKKRRKNEDEDEFDSREIFIPKESTRGLGGVEYVPDNIHPNTMHFLRDLKRNNEREWFWNHEGEYRSAKKDFDEFIEQLSEHLPVIDPTVPPLPLKDILYRIYRDIRFTNDKTPFKPYFAASYSRTGRTGHYAHYYLHFEPGSIRLGAGMWQLGENGAEGLQTMRRLIDRGGERLKDIINHPDMAKYYFTDPNKSALDQFVAMNQGDALKKCPKGYSKDHKDIGLLRLKTFSVLTHVSDDEFAPGKKPIGMLVERFKVLVPFVNLLNAVVMDGEETDESGDSQDEE
ncbi:hypothetical protein V1512DRAFT_258095 [Lipomyces arxii]|uniref:uncharacterized protein n=1 Tax=Lipomyces arxii TaxID=56418 RepID=UPI0034CEC69D